MPNAKPEGMHTITPHIACADAVAAIEFYKKAFGAIELMRLPAPDGKLVHGCIRIGDSAVMLMDARLCPQGTPGIGEGRIGDAPITLHLYVEDADALFAQALAQGAKVKMPMTDMFWGDRYGVVTDPFGHAWAIATHVRDVDPQELQEAAAKMFAAPQA